MSYEDINDVMALLNLEHEEREAARKEAERKAKQGKKSGRRKRR